MKFDVIRITAKTGSTGTASYSHNLGETPKLALFIIPDFIFSEETFRDTVAGMSFGATDGVRNRCGYGGVTDAGANHKAQRAIHTDACIVSYQPGSSTILEKAVFSSWNTATFTLNWTAINDTRPVYVILFSGADFNARVDHGSMRTSTGTQDYTGVASGKALITWAGGAITSVNSLLAGMGLSLGFVDEAGNARARSCFAQDASNTVAYYSDIGVALLANSSAGEISAKAAFTSHNPSGAASFRLNFTTPAAGAWQFIYIHLGGAGLKANAGHFTTSPNNTITTAGMRPRAILFSGNGVSTLNGVVGDIMFSIGAARNVEADEYCAGVNMDSANGVCSSIASKARALTHALNGGTSETNGIVELSRADTQEEFKTAKSAFGANFVPFYLALGVTAIVPEEHELEGEASIEAGGEVVFHGELDGETGIEAGGEAELGAEYSLEGEASVEAGGGVAVESAEIGGYHFNAAPLRQEYEAEIECKHSHNGDSDWLQLNLRLDPDPGVGTFYGFRWGGRATDPGAPGVTVIRSVDGQIEFLHDEPVTEVPFIPNQFYTLKFYTDIEGGDVRLTAYLDDVEVASVLDSNAEKITDIGLAGVAGGMGGDDRVITYDNLILRSAITGHELEGEAAIEAGGEVAFGGQWELIGEAEVGFGGVAQMQALYDLIGEAGIQAGGVVTMVTDVYRLATLTVPHNITAEYPVTLIEIASVPSLLSPSGPTAGKYTGVVMEHPQVSEESQESFMGVRTKSDVEVRVSWPGGPFKVDGGVEIRGWHAQAWRRRHGANESIFRGKVSSLKVGHEIRVTLRDAVRAALLEDLPGRFIGTTEYPKAKDLGKAINIASGTNLRIPCPNIEWDDLNRIYRHALGEGTGYGGGHWGDLTRVYWEDAALSQLTGQVVSATSGTLTIEPADAMPVNFLKHWFAEITSGTGSGQVRRIAQHLQEQVVSVSPVWSPTPNASSQYRLREWRWYSGGQASPYPGIAVLEFGKPPADQSRILSVYADGEALQGEKNYVRMIQSLLSNAVWGKGLDVDADAFDEMAALTEILALSCDGILTKPQQVMRILNDLSKVRGIWLSS